MTTSVFIHVLFRDRPDHVGNLHLFLSFLLRRLEVLLRLLLVLVQPVTAFDKQQEAVETVRIDLMNLLDMLLESITIRERFLRK